MTRDDIVKQALHKLGGHDERMWLSYDTTYDFIAESRVVCFKCSCGAKARPLKVPDEYLAQHPLAFYELPLRW